MMQHIADKTLEQAGNRDEIRATMQGMQGIRDMTRPEVPETSLRSKNVP